MSNQELGIWHSTFNRTGAPAGIGFRRTSDACLGVVSFTRGQSGRHLAQPGMPNADYLFSPHIARSCTVMLRNTSVTNRGLADSVLIDVGKPRLGQRSRGGGWLAVTRESCAIGPLEEALASNRGK